MTATARRWLIGLVALASTLAACGNPNSGDQVAVVGDSITSLDKPALQEDLGGTYDLTIVGDFGATISEVMPAAQLVAGEEPQQVVINLGTNDVIAAGNLAESVSTLAAMVDTFDAAECVHLVNINEHMVELSTGESRRQQAEQFNSALEDLAGDRERVSIIGWNDVVESTLDDDDPPTSTLTKDSIHPTQEGNGRLNDLYAEALSGC